MVPLPRAELRDLQPVEHGGNAPSGSLDFSTGVCPLPPPDSVLEAIRRADVTRYPHPTALPLRSVVAQAHQMTAEDVVVGNGSTELIWALARAFGGEGRTVLILGPAFGEYAQSARACGSKVVELHCLLSRWDPDRICDEAQRAAAALVFVCRPSNPCLTALPSGAVAHLAQRLPRALIVIDEAYLPLFEGVRPEIPGGNVAVLRSLTKTFALPGLRLGYLLAAASIAAAVRAALPPWNVSAPAMLAGEAALVHGAALDAVRSEVARLRRALCEGLAAVGARIDAAGGPFVLCQVERATHLTQRLRERGICVRDCTSFGMPGHVRIGVRPLPEQEALVRAWREVVEVAA